MRTIFRACLMALCMTFCLPGISGADEKQDVETLMAGLQENFPELGKVRDANKAAREKFIILFPGPPKAWAEKLLKTVNGVSRYEAESMHRDGKSGENARRTYIQRMERNTRYMRLITETPATDPAFLILLRPVTLNSSYSSDRKIIETTLKEFDEYTRTGILDPEKYRTKKINGHYWGVIHYPTMEVSSGSDDKSLAHVMRVKDGAFSLSPIFAPVREDYYPGEKSPLRPAQREKGPQGLNINDCRMENVLTLTESDGMFGFRADARQRFATNLSYTCEPKCTGFVYTWSEVTESFHMSDPVCREDDGWKPKSPFDGTTLVPVRDFKTQMGKEDLSLADHEKALQRTATAFTGLFAGQAGKFAKETVADWLFDRDLALYSHVGKQKEFTARLLGHDAPVLAYMQKVVDLAQKPDARLVLLLDDFARRQGFSEQEKKYYENRRDPSPYDLIHSPKAVPWFVKYSQDQLALLTPPVKDKSGRVAYAAKGLEGGDSIEFAYERYGYNREKAAFDYNRFSMRSGSDGAHWGLSEVTMLKKSRYNPRASKLEVPQTRIMRVLQGTISFVTPALPNEKEFFTNPEMRHDKVVWKDQNGNVAYCYTAPVFSVGTANTPFALTAHNRQLESDYVECVPECSIPFTWDGNAYLKGTPICLPEGQWGVKKRENRR